MSGSISDDDAVDVAAVELRSRIGAGAWSAWAPVASISELTVTGSGKIVNFDFDFLSTGEAPEVQTIELRAWDNDPDGEGPVVGDATALAFYLDNNSPLIDEITINTSAQVVSGGDVTFDGTSSDTNAIASVDIDATKDTVSVGELYSTTSGGAYNFVHTIDPGGSDDGVWVYTITATDAAGRTSDVTRNVLVDATDPTLPVIDPFAGVFVADELVANGTSLDSGSGLQTVEASVDYTNDGDDGNDTWTAVTGTENWYVTLDVGATGANLSEGVQTLYVRSNDRAGNTSVIANRSFTVDRANPAVVVNGYTETEYRNADVMIDGTATDVNGVASVVVTYNKDGGGDVPILNDTTDDGLWNLTLTLDPDGPDDILGNADDIGDGEYLFTIVTTDSVAKSTTVTRLVIVDTVLPTAIYTSLVPVIGTDTVNGKITVRASVADGIALDYVEWALLPAAATPGDPDYTTVTGSKTSPVIDIDTTIATANVVVNGSAPYDRAVADEASSKLWIRAFDRASNVFEISQNLSVSQASDSPQITFTSIDISATTPADSDKNLIESNAVILFTVNDDDMIDASTIEISVDDNVSWIPVNRNGGAALIDGVIINTSHNLSLPTTIVEGTHHFYLRADDEASAKNGLPAVQQEIGPIYFMVDRNFPVVTETTLVDPLVYQSALYQLDGAISDSNAIKNITIVETKDGSVDTEVLNTDVTGTSDTYTVPNMPAGGVTDGNFLYTITLTDASNKQTVITRTVIIDTTDPSAPVTVNPASGAWLNSSTYIFDGTSTDGAGSGIDKVYYTETADGAGAPPKGDPSYDEASVDGAGNWSASVTIAAAGTRDLHLYSVDAAGNDSTIATHDFGLDQAGPAVNVTGGVSTQFVNGDFTIDGTFTDASGVASIDVESSTDNVIFVAADPTTAPFVNGPDTWSWDRVIGAQIDGTYYYRFSVTDLAGNSTQLTKTVNLDTLAPAISFDSTSPSISFNGPGKTAVGNGTLSLSGSISEDQGVGNIQSIEYQFNALGWNALAVAGSYTVASIDTTSFPDLTPLNVGIRATDLNGNQLTDTFVIAVDQSTDKPVVSITAPVDLATIMNTSVTVIGGITDDDGVSGDPGTVEYRYHNGTAWGSWTDVTVSGSPTARSFNFAINSASNGLKQLEMRAVDTEAIASDTVAISFTFDTDEPEFTGLAPAEGTYFNADFSVTGTVSDATGVVDYLRYRVERNTVETTPWTYIFGPGNLTASEPINQSIDTSAGTGSFEVFLEASDGSFTRSQSITVNVDKIDPAAAFTDPAPASTQNNIITISGTSSDNSGVQSIDFKAIDVNSGNSEEVLPTGTPAGTTSWTISGFDTRDATLLSYANDMGGGVYELTLRVLVTDLAGNTYTSAGGSDLVFQIDQSSDNPVVTFDDILFDGSSTITSTVIDGSVSDDDGVASIQVDMYAVDNSITTETVNLTSGSYGDTSVDWRVTLTSSENGLRGIQVIAVDTVNNDPNSSVDTGEIDVKLDTEDPDVAIAAPLANITWSANDSFDVSGTSDDETGITNLDYKIDDNDFGSGTTVINPPHDNWSFNIAQGALANGPHTIYVQATDSVGNTKIASRQISVDKTAPTINVTSPPNGTAVFGPLTIGGTTADNAGGAGVAAVSVGLGKQINPGDLEGSTWNAVPGTTSWSFSFPNINDYANTTYSHNTGDTNLNDIEDGVESWTAIWDFTFYVRAIDSAGDLAGGNISYLQTYTLQIDPLQDRPDVAILSPSDGATVGGFVRIFGSAFDSQFVDKVQIAIDANDNGDYTDDAWAEGAFDEVDAGVNWYLTSGTTSWSVNINENTEFDPVDPDTTRTIVFKVRAKDYKVAPGDGIYGAEVEYSITFNKDFPQFGTMSLVSGATVGGVVTFDGLVRDETDIDRIIYSNEGPLLDNTIIFDNPGGLVPPGAANTDVSSAAAIAKGITVTLLGTSDPDYDAAFPGSYHVDIPIDTEAAGLYPNGAGSMSVKLTAEDTTTPSPFTNQYLLSLNVDNIDPSLLTYTGDAEIIGTSAELKGTVKDTGTVSGIDRIVVYVTNAASEIVRLQTAPGTIAGFLEADVLDEGNATYDDYRMIIDNALEDGNDGGAAGDSDGIPEYFTLSAGTYNWSGLFDSNLIPDGVVTVHYIAEDFAGNSASGTTGAFVANNKPSIDSIVLGTDLDGNGTVDGGEQTSPITSGYGATNYTARNDRLYFGINSSGGNGTLRYSILYLGGEQNGTLTNSTLTIDTSGFSDSTVANDKSFTIKVYDSTTSDDADDTDELFETITVNLTIDNVDTVSLTITIAAFGMEYSLSDDDSAKILGAVADYEDNIEMSGSVRLGHVEYAADSNFDGADSDLSGSVIFKGKVEDNQQVDRISATIPGYDGGPGQGSEFDIYDAGGAGELSGTGWAFTIVGTNYLTESFGNVFNWNFQWDSAGLAALVDTDVSVTFNVYDSANSANDALTFDVVPYISDVSTDLTGVRDANIRGATGKYSVQISNSALDTITINGFNLDPIANGVRISSDADGLVGITLQGDALTIESQGSPYTSVTIRKNATRSGYLAVVGGTAGVPISATNNYDSAATYNDEPSTSQANPTLTDDRYIMFFDVFDTGFVNGNYPEMIMNGDVPVFGFVDDSAANDLQFTRGEVTSETGVGGTANTTVYGLLRGLGFQYYAMARDGAGIYHQLSSSTFNSMQQYYIYGEYAPDYMGGCGGGFTNNCGATQVYWSGFPGGVNRAGATGNDSIVLDELDYAPGLLVGRYKNPRLIATGDSTAGGGHASVYMSFYDSNTSEIIFRNFQVGDDPGTGTNAFNDAVGANLAELTGTTSGDTTRHTVTSSASQYFDMGITDAGFIVIVYYNQSASRLELVYSSTTAGGTTAQSLDGANPATAVFFSAPTIVSTQFVGNYVSIAVENKAGADPIHVAAHDSSGADLTYIRFDDYTDTNPEVVTVDANLSVGIWTDIAVDTNGRPHIGYYNSSQTGTNDSVKVAWPIGNVAAGVDAGVNGSGEVTGDWEFVTIPANDQPAGGIVQFKRVNIGFDSSGDPVVGYLADDIEYARYMPEI